MNRRPFVFTFPGQEALAARLTAGLVDGVRDLVDAVEGEVAQE